MSIFPCGLCCSVCVQFLSSSLQISKSSDKKFACDFKVIDRFQFTYISHPEYVFLLEENKSCTLNPRGKFVSQPASSKYYFFFHAVCSSFELGVITNLFMTGFTGNRELCFPTAFNVEGLGETNVPVTLRAIH